MMSTYGWSADGEGYRGKLPTREEAAAAGFAADPDEVFGDRHEVIYTAENGQPPTAGSLVPDMAEVLLDYMADSAGDEHGAGIEEWRDAITHAQVRALHAALVDAVDAWAAEQGCGPTFYNVGHEQRHELPTE